MLKSVFAALALGALAVPGFGGTAQASDWTCAMPITKGGCPVLVYQPDQQPATPF